MRKKWWVTIYFDHHAIGDFPVPNHRYAVATVKGLNNAVGGRLHGSLRKR